MWGIPCRMWTDKWSQVWVAKKKEKENGPYEFLQESSQEDSNLKQTKLTL